MTRSVLVVDDDSQFRELAASALSWHPRVVLTSIDGDITTAEDAQRAGARAFVHKADLPDAPLARLLGGEEL